MVFFFKMITVSIVSGRKLGWYTRSSNNNVSLNKIMGSVRVAILADRFRLLAESWLITLLGSLLSVTWTSLVLSDDIRGTNRLTKMEVIFEIPWRFDGS